MAAGNLDAADLAAALAAPGLIREDVMDTVYNLDEGIPTTLTDMIGSGSHDNPYSEWTENDLAAVDMDNAVVDGADATGNDTKIGLRVGNRNQLADKVVRVSTTSNAVNSIGGQGSYAYQTAKRMMDLRRDVEGIICGRQASQVDDGNTVPGKTGALFATIATNTSFGVGGSAGGFNTGTKVVEAPTAGNARALTWEGVRDQIEAVYTLGGMPSVLMSVPGVIRRLNSFLFSDAGNPYRADPTANVGGTGGGSAQTAQGFINVVLSDFGIELSLRDNRLQQTYQSSDGSPVDVADVGILDPRFLQLSYLEGYRNDPLAKTGHSDQGLLCVQFMLKNLREDAHANIADVDPTAAVTAS